MRDMTERKRYFAARQPERAREIGRVVGAKNDWSKGSRNPKAKLTPIQVAHIRQSKEVTKTLAAKFGVNRSTIQGIRAGRLWKN